jgi:sortase B
VSTTPSATPQTTVTASPLPGENLNASPAETDDGYPREELNGVAREEDNLPILDSYKEAKAINHDVIGWITIDGTVIDYPVVRSTDNDYYLDHNVEKDKSRYGSIFMDFRNAESYQQRHIIIYGHNMKNGTMFHDLMNFKQKDFFDAHRTVKLYWDGVETEWQIYLAYIVMPNTIYHIHVRFADDQEFADIMNQTIEYAKTVKPMNYDSAVTIMPNDQVLTLSTCTYEYDGSYFAVMAKRVK